MVTHLTAYTPHTLHTAERLRRALGIVRITGNAVAHQELVLGESAVAVPVFGCGGEAMAALEVELHDVRADLELCKAALTVAARGLSRELAVDHDRVEAGIGWRLECGRPSAGNGCRARRSPWPAGHPSSSAATGGSAPPTCAPSGTARAPRRWASTPPTTAANRSSPMLNTWSDINPCHTHFKQRVEDVKRGVWSAGGFPVEMPAMSLSEPFQKPTTMLYRNLLAMEAEELLRSYPVDGAVLMGGCDKTTPGLLMGASSMNLPTLFLPAGPMLRGHWGGTTLGSGSDVWRYWAELRAGNITQQDWQEIENGIARSPGHCMTMGTASTMTSAAEALGSPCPARPRSRPRTAGTR